MSVATFFERPLAERYAAKVIERMRRRNRLKVPNCIRYADEGRPHDFGGAFVGRSYEIDVPHKRDHFLEQGSVVTKLDPEFSACSGFAASDYCFMDEAMILSKIIIRAHHACMHDTLL